MPSPIRIDKCVCCSKQFSELKRVADQTDSSTVEDLQRHAEFGTGCGLCKPYVRRMLRTGETVFHEIISQFEDG